MATSLVGMAWLGQLHAGSAFVLGVALPMALVGAGMGASLALLTISGVAGVAPADAGSASGLVGVAHQLGGALGLAVLVVVFASVGVSAGTPAPVEQAHRIGMALSGAAALLAAALLPVLVFVARRRHTPQHNGPTPPDPTVSTTQQCHTAKELR